MDVTRHLTYQGPAARAHILARMLKQEGVRAHWTPPAADPAAAFITVTVRIAATGPPDAIESALAKFRAKGHHGTVTAESQD